MNLFVDGTRPTKMFLRLRMVVTADRSVSVVISDIYVWLAVITVL